MRDAHTHSMGRVPPLFYQPLRGGRIVPRLLIRTGRGVPSAELKRSSPVRPSRPNPDDAAVGAPRSSRRESKWGPMLARGARRVRARAGNGRHVRCVRLRRRQRTRESASAWRSARSHPPWCVWCWPDTRARSPRTCRRAVRRGGLVHRHAQPAARSQPVRSGVRILAWPPLLAAAGLAASYVPARRAGASIRSSRYDTSRRTGDQ